MNVTKCDVCGRYIDNNPAIMPGVRLAKNKLNPNSFKNYTVCYECFNNVAKIFEKEENKDE